MNYLIKYLFLIIVLLIALMSCNDSINDIQTKRNVTIITPNGGEIFLFSEMINVEWSYEIVNEFNLHLSIDSGATWRNVSENIQDTNSFSFLYPDTIQSDYCLIKVEDSRSNSIYDTSDGLFKIKKDSLTKDKSLKIIYPNGNEVFFVGDTINIKWEYENINSFNIVLSLDNGKSWSVITQNLMNESEYLFYLEENVSNECLIKVEDFANNTVYDISDTNFQIKPKFDSSYLDYFQFSEGNFWVDSVHTYDAIEIKEKKYLEKSTYEGFVEINGFFYHKINKRNTLGENHIVYFTIDDETGYVYKKVSQTSNIGRFETDIDLEEGSYNLSLYDRWITVTKESYNIFNEMTEILKHEVSNSELEWTYKFSKKYGIVYYNAPAYMGFKNYILKGCKINSQIFGDTTMTTNNPVHESLKLYPLRVGKSWNFSYEEKVNDSLIKSSFYRRNIEKDTTINNKRYYKIFTTIDDSTYEKIEFEKIDSNNAFVYRYNEITEEDILVDRLYIEDYSSWNDTYRFYNEKAVKNENWIEKPYYFERITYNDSSDCLTETYIYGLKENIGLSEIILFGCNKNIYIKLLE